MTLKDILTKYMDGTYTTLQEAAKENGYTVDQLKYFIRKLKNSKELAEKKLYILYLDTARERRKQAKIKGGQNGKRKTTYSIGEIETWFNMIVNGDMTLDEVSNQTGIPKAVIHENLANNLTPKQKLELDITYANHKRCAANNYKNDTENSHAFHKEGKNVTNSLQRSKR